MWSDWHWPSKFLAIQISKLLDIHPPSSNRGLRCKKSPWINSLFIHKVRERDSLKKRFDKNPNDLVGESFIKKRAMK